MPLRPGAQGLNYCDGITYSSTMATGTGMSLSPGVSVVFFPAFRDDPQLDAIKAIIAIAINAVPKFFITFFIFLIFRINNLLFRKLINAL